MTKEILEKQKIEHYVFLHNKALYNKEVFYDPFIFFAKGTRFPAILFPFKVDEDFLRGFASSANNYRKGAQLGEKYAQERLNRLVDEKLSGLVQQGVESFIKNKPSLFSKLLFWRKK